MEWGTCSWYLCPLELRFLCASRPSVGFTVTRAFMILYIRQTLSDVHPDCRFSSWRWATRAEVVEDWGHEGCSRLTVTAPSPMWTSATGDRGPIPRMCTLALEAFVHTILADRGFRHLWMVALFRCGKVIEVFPGEDIAGLVVEDACLGPAFAKGEGICQLCCISCFWLIARGCLLCPQQWCLSQISGRPVDLFFWSLSWWSQINDQGFINMKIGGTLFK